MSNADELLRRVEEAIRRRGTYPFSGRELAAKIGVCRQTVYKKIYRLVEQGHRIQGDPRLGFMARMKCNDNDRRENVRPTESSRDADRDGRDLRRALGD